MILEANQQQISVRSSRLHGNASRIVLFFAGVLLLTLTCLSLPQGGPPLGDDVDSSLGAVLHYAQEHHLQYGTDLVFTYGPLGFLTFFYYFPHAFALQVTAHFIVAFIAATGVCLVASRLQFIWRWLLVLTFLWVSSNAWPRDDLIINIGLFCWALLCFIESAKRLILSVCVFVTLAAFGALTKISFLFVGAGSIVLLAVDLFIRGLKPFAFGIVGGWIVAFLLGWVISGQDLRHIAAFLANSWAAVQGYNAAMGQPGADIVQNRGLIWSLLSLALLLCWAFAAFDARSEHVRWRRLLLLVWAAFFMFAMLKHGFVRLDRFHVLVALAFAAVAVLALHVVPVNPGRIRCLFCALTVAGWLLPIVTLQSLFLPSWLKSITQPLRSLTEHTAALATPSAYHKPFDEALEASRRAAQLPHCRELIGSASVDVFGQHAGYAIFNDLNYHPRPIFQSYFAANARLESLNEGFFRSRRAPEFVLFGYSWFDQKFPALPDGRALVHLLSNEELVTVENHFLLLKKKTSDPVQRTFVAQGMVRPSERIDLQPYGDTNLWLEIELRPALAGRARHWLYRPPQIRLAAWEGGTGKLLVRNRAPAPMLEAGFLASPLLLNLEDVEHLYNGIDPKRPAAYSVELPRGEEYLWQSEIGWRLYRIENHLGKSFK